MGKARTRYEALGLSVLEEAGPRPGRRYGSFIVQGSVLGHRYEALGLSVSEKAGPGTGMKHWVFRCLRR